MFETLCCVETCEQNSECSCSLLSNQLSFATGNMHSHLDPLVSHSPPSNIFMGLCLQALTILKTALLMVRTKIFLQGQILTMAKAVIHTLVFTSTVYTHGIQLIKPVLVLKQWNAVTAAALHSHQKEIKSEYCLQQRAECVCNSYTCALSIWEVWIAHLMKNSI